MGGTIYNFDGNAYENAETGIRSAEFTSVLWNGQVMDAFGHIMAPEPESESDINWDEDDDDDDDDDDGGDDNNDGQDPGDQQEEDQWGRPRPNFHDLRQDERDGRSGGQCSREESYHHASGWRPFRNHHLSVSSSSSSSVSSSSSITGGVLYSTALEEHQVNFQGMPLLTRPHDEEEAVSSTGFLVDKLRSGLADIPTGIVDESPVVSLLGLIHQFAGRD